MIKIKIQRQKKKNKSDKNRIVYFEIKDHANFSEHGEDIVCAAVSSVGQMTVNGLIEILQLEKKLKYSESEGCIICDLKNSDLTDEEFEKADILCDSMYSYLKDVAKDYKEFVKLTETVYHKKDN